MPAGNYVSVLSHGLLLGISGGGVDTVPTLELCDDLITELNGSGGLGASDTAARAYWSRTADAEDTALALSSAGRKITIAPSQPTAYSYEPETRGRDLWTHHVSVLVENRWDTSTAGDPTDDWIDEQVAWVKTYIVSGFDWDFRTGAIPTFNRLLVTVSAETQLFDPDLLRHDKLFSSQVDLIFQELVDA